MSIEASRVGRLRLFQEPNGQFGTDHSGTMGDFIDVPFIEGTLQMELSKPSESPSHPVQKMWDYHKEVLLPKRASLSFSMNLATFPTKADDGVTATQLALGAMLDIGMGGETLGVGNTVNGTSATTTAITLTDATNFPSGTAVGFLSGSNGEMEIREIDTVTGNRINLKVALTTAPSNADDAYGSASYYLGATDGSLITSYQFAVEGQEQDDRWLLMGGQLSSPPSFDLTPGGLGRVNFQMQFADWDIADGSSTVGTLTGSDLSLVTYSEVPLVVADSEYRLGTVANNAITGTLIHPSSFSFEPNFSYAPVVTPAGTNTILQYCPVRPQGAPVSGQFTLPYQDTTYFSARDNRTNRAVFFQLGTSATDGGILITAPTVQIKEPQIDGSSGIQNQVVRWVGRGDDEVSATSDRAQSPFRIHIV